MKKECNIDIITRAGSGEALKTKSRGSYYLKRGKSYVIFETEGDRCRIEFDEKELLYKRLGELNYALVLASGEKTETDMISSVGRSHIECLTKSYSAEIKKDVININIGYNIAGEELGMEITITGEFL